MILASLWSQFLSQCLDIKGRLKVFTTVLLLIGPSVTWAFETKIDLAIRAAVSNEIPSAANIATGWAGLVSTVGNQAMWLQSPLKLIFGDRVRDFEVMYKVTYQVESEVVECLALAKAPTRFSESYKVFIGHCGQAGEIAMFTSGPDNGPKYLKQILFNETNQVVEINSLPLTAYESAP